MKGTSVKLTKEEIRRKLLHLFALLMPIAIFYAPGWSFHPLIVPGVLGMLFVSSVLVELIRFKVPWVQDLFFKLFGSMLRKEEHFKITGSTWVIGAAFLCSILFRGYPHISFMVLFLFILGDAVAALVGISIGRVKIGKKSLEGSLACFLLCVVLFYALFPFIPGLLESLNHKVPPLLILVTAFVITIFELVPLRIHPLITINDNLAVPIIAGYVMMGLEKILID
jgi:dolichol kinase